MAINITNYSDLYDPNKVNTKHNNVQYFQLPITFHSGMGNIKDEIILNENNNSFLSNDNYRNNTGYTVEDSDQMASITTLLFQNGSYLKGTLDKADDVDYYSFQLNLLYQLNKDTTIYLENIPKDTDYNISLYDEYGNQIGIGETDSKEMHI